MHCLCVYLDGIFIDGEKYIEIIEIYAKSGDFSSVCDDNFLELGEFCGT